MSFDAEDMKTRLATAEMKIEVLSDVLKLMAQQLTPAQQASLKQAVHATIRPQHEVDELLKLSLEKVGTGKSTPGSRTADRLLEENNIRRDWHEKL